MSRRRVRLAEGERAYRDGAAGWSIKPGEVRSWPRQTTPALVQMLRSGRIIEVNSETSQAAPGSTQAIEPPVAPAPDPVPGPGPLPVAAIDAMRQMLAEAAAGTLPPNCLTADGRPRLTPFRERLAAVGLADFELTAEIRDRIYSEIIPPQDGA